PLLHRFALEYPHYALPAGMPSGDLPAQATPRRLAFVRIPGGQNALIHSVSLPEENRGRANNFLSHVLICPSLKPRDALATWASLEWAEACEQGTELSRLDELPAAGPISDEAVTAFLKEKAPAPDANLATLISPARLASSPRKRRELLRLVLTGCQLVLDKAPGAARGRLYVLAEPGLTALLLYAATRLLPDSLARKLTFSTYEHYRRDLRSYKHALVVGTYTADPAEGLDKDFYTVHGYALDTFQHTCSPELSATDGGDMGEWIDLAARGEWTTVDRIHGVMGKKNAAVISVQDALQAFSLSQSLAAGEANVQDLLRARGTAWGATILRRYRDAVWPIVRDASLDSPVVRDAFAEMLWEHRNELQQRASGVLRTLPAGDSPAQWQAHWQLLQSVWKVHPAKLWDVLGRILPPPPYPAGLRAAVLDVLQNSGTIQQTRKVGCQPLLRGCTSADLQQLAESSLDRRWFVRALCYSLLERDTEAAAARYLHSGDDLLIRVFWKEFRLVKSESQRRVLLAPLFGGADDPRRFLSRSLKYGCRLPAQTWQRLLDLIDSWSKEWTDFWTSDNHLGSFLHLLRACGKEAAPLWQRFSAQLNEGLLVPGDAYQKALLMELLAAKECPGKTLPGSVARCAADWGLLRDHFEKAAAIPEERRKLIIEACERRGIDAVELLTRYFERFVLPQRLKKEVVDDFIGFFHTFCPPKGEYQAYSCRLLWWLQMAESCPEHSSRAIFQRYYLEKHVPLAFRWRLAEENFRSGKLLESVFEHLPRPTEAGAATAVPDGEDGFGVGPVGSLRLRKQLILALLLGLACGAGAGGLAKLLGETMRLALYLGIGIAGGIIGGSILSLLVFSGRRLRTTVVALSTPPAEGEESTVAPQQLPPLSGPHDQGSQSAEGEAHQAGAGGVAEHDNLPAEDG
ncbi:MAG TPA: hypothetical protein VGY58_10110, partial [Gemmataceae bacterium]|nr:hypothetical protein [Gemmataceae bacterium]